MKQFLLKGMATRLIGLVVAFLMVASPEGRAQTTRDVSSTDEWNTAISSLQENDIIQLTADVTMTQDNMPAVACTINGGGYTLTGIEDPGNSPNKIFNLKAATTFINTKITSNLFFANGHTLQFTGNDNTLSGDLFGGHATDEVSSTNIIIEGGSFGWINGGGWNGSVTGECYLKISGNPTISGTVFGGSNQGGTTVGSTHVEISGGTLGWINGGGYNCNVTGECYLKISGNPTIVGNVFGGSNQKGTTVGSTRVEISGGTFKDSGNQTIGGSVFAGGWGCTVTGNTSIIATGGTMGFLYGGCSQGSVEGKTYVEVNGATLDGGTNSGSSNSATIYGGGFGDDKADDGYNADLGKVGSTKVLVKSLTSGTGGVILFGGGLFAGVTGNTDVTIENGTFTQVWGGSNTESIDNTQYQGTVGGDVNVLVKGGEIGTLGAARDQRPGQAAPVGGNMNLTIEGGKITRQIISGNHPNGNGYKPCTLTIRNQGTENTPFKLPETYAITNMVLDNSIVTYREPEVSSDVIILHAISINKDYPMAISGSGKLTGSKIILSNFNTGSLPIDVPLVTGDEQLKDASFIAYEGLGDGTVQGLSLLPVYKVGDTYRKTEKVDPGEDIVKAKVVTINQPSHGTLTVKWIESGRENILDDGDQAPANAELTLSAVPASGYRLKSGSLKVYKTGESSTTVALTGSTFNMPDYDVTVTAEFVGTSAPLPSVYHRVTLPVVEGATTSPAAGDHVVESGYGFRFYLTLDAAYDKSTPVISTSRGEIITPRASDGAYVVNYVTEPIVISISGVVKNDPTANTELRSGIKVWVSNHQLFIRTDKPEDVAIYSFSGQLKKAFRSTGGDESVSLSAGSYMVCIGKERIKIVM